MDFTLSEFYHVDFNAEKAKKNYDILPHVSNLKPRILFHIYERLTWIRSSLCLPHC